MDRTAFLSSLPYLHHKSPYKWPPPSSIPLSENVFVSIEPTFRVFDETSDDISPGPAFFIPASGTAANGSYDPAQCGFEACAVPIVGPGCAPTATLTPANNSARPLGLDKPARWRYRLYFRFDDGGIFEADHSKIVNLNLEGYGTNETGTLPSLVVRFEGCSFRIFTFSNGGRESLGGTFESLSRLLNDESVGDEGHKWDRRHSNMSNVGNDLSKEADGQGKEEGPGEAKESLRTSSTVNGTDCRNRSYRKSWNSLQFLLSSIFNTCQSEPMDDISQLWNTTAKALSQTHSQQTTTSTDPDNAPQLSQIRQRLQVKIEKLFPAPPSAGRKGKKRSRYSLELPDRAKAFPARDTPSELEGGGNVRDLLNDYKIAMRARHEMAVLPGRKDRRPDTDDF